MMSRGWRPSMKAYRPIIFAVSAAALFCFLRLPLRAMWNSSGAWVRTRADDELIIVAMASKDPTIGVVYLLKDPNAVDAQEQKVKALGATVKHTDRKIGYLRTVVPTEAVHKA